jgi:hypothetical protein
MSRVSRALAAGITWTSRTNNAQWAGREGHTSVIDIAGAIYVIGGYGGDDVGGFQDVWKSTDGGASQDSVRLAVFVARPATCGRPHVRVCVCAIGRCRARWPQVSRGPISRPRRRGLRE